ncbi:RNA polymerase sigma-70 factor [Prolixibacteraceae bacterium JC049]|nr:RNA polymerase sigma-70 factor [Prolixibacteraceae bacterium JC049]
MNLKKDFKHISLDVVRRFRKGDDVAFKQLFEFYSTRLYGFVFKLIKDDSESEEIVQDVFFKIWKHREEIRTDEAFKSYLFKIALNNIRNYFTRLQKEEHHKQEIVREYLLNTEEDGKQISYNEAMKKVDELIELLPEKRREIFLMSRKEGLSILEIAKYLNLSEATVKNQITSAMNFLREEAKKHDFGIYLFLLLNY